MDLQRRCDPQPPRAPQEEVTLLLSCSLSFLSVSTSLSVLSFLQFCLRLFPLSSLSLWPSSPTCLSPRPPPPSSRLCAASPVTQRLSKASLSFLHCHSLFPPPAFLSLHLSWVCPSLFSGSLPKLAQPAATSSSVAARPLLAHMKFTRSDAGHLVSLPRCPPPAFLSGKPLEASEKTPALRLDARSL